MTERLVMLEEQYKIFTDLNQELVDIKEIENIITQEKGNHDRNPKGNHLIKRTYKGRYQEIILTDQAQQMQQISPCRVIQQQQSGVSRAT